MGTLGQRCVRVVVLLAAVQPALAHPTTPLVYVTGRVTEQDGQVFLSSAHDQRYRLQPAVPVEPGTLLHVSGTLAANGTLQVRGSTPVRAPERTVFPVMAPDDLAILAVEPYSQRTLHFAHAYAEMAEGVRGYLGAPAVVSSYDFEPHVMADLHWYLEQMEQVLALLERLDQGGSSSMAVLGDVVDLLGRNGLRSAGVKLCLGGKGNADAWDVLTHWPALGAQCHAALKELYLRLSSLNVFLFRHNASAELSPYRRYFEQARGDPFFNGRVDFPDDVNGILREAFYHLFLAAQAERLEARQQHMEHFNLLLIAHEQMLAQPFYKAMASQQEALAGSIVLHDPLGTYALVDEPWSNFGARMSLDLPPGTPVETVTVETLLANTARPGTVPHYYRSRLRHPDATLLFNTPPEVQRVSLEHPAGAGTDGNTLMQRHGCLSCHRVDVEADVGTMVGPDLSRVGARLSADQIRQAIVDPGRTLARDASGRSYPPGIMPVSYAKALRADEIDVLTRHLATHR